MAVGTPARPWTSSDVVLELLMSQGHLGNMKRERTGLMCIMYSVQTTKRGKKYVCNAIRGGLRHILAGLVDARPGAFLTGHQQPPTSNRHDRGTTELL